MIELPVFGILVDTDANRIFSEELHEVCPCCSKPDCYFDCDESQAEDSSESEVEAIGRIKANAAIDGILSTVLAHAVAGINIESPAYLEGIETAFDGVMNNVG